MTIQIKYDPENGNPGGEYLAENFASAIEYIQGLERGAEDLARAERMAIPDDEEDGAKEDADRLADAINPKDPPLLCRFTEWSDEARDFVTGSSKDHRFEGSKLFCERCGAYKPDVEKINQS